MMSNNNKMTTMRGKRMTRRLSSSAAAAVLVIATMTTTTTPTASAIYIERDDKYDNNNNNNNKDAAAAARDLQAATTNSKTYLVTFADTSISPAKRCDALAKSNGMVVSHVYDTVLNGCALTAASAASSSSSAAQTVQATLTALSSAPAVSNVEMDQRMYALATPSSSWGLDRIDQCTLPLNNLMTKQDASGVTMFIIDTGIKNDHEELKNSMSTMDCHISQIANEPAFSDGNGHG
jgi:subtilisin family serine protease